MQERKRATEREVRRKHEQLHQAAKLHSLLSSMCIEIFLSLSKLISFIQISVPELWVPEDVCEIRNNPHFPNFWPHGCNVIIVIRVPLPARGPGEVSLWLCTA